jgi:hypothetical protein
MKRHRRTYRACPIKRNRRSKAEIDVIKAAIVAVLRADNPMTVRQVFYQLVARDVIEKTEEQYQGTVIRLLTEMRMNREVSFDWIIDESRRARQTQTFDSIADAVQDTARFYRRSALRDCKDYIEVWSEKEALAGIIWDAASDYDVPVIVSKGMPSITQLYGTAREIARAAHAGKQTYIYQFGDHDPSGVLIPKTIEHRLDQLCEKFDCQPPTIERVALTEEQITEFNLPTRPTKRNGNMHANSFEGDSVELDALPAGELRDLVCACIEQHITQEALHTRCARPRTRNASSSRDGPMRSTSNDRRGGPRAQHEEIAHIYEGNDQAAQPRRTPLRRIFRCLPTVPVERRVHQCRAEPLDDLQGAQGEMVRRLQPVLQLEA